MFHIKYPNNQTKTVDAEDILNELYYKLAV